MTRTYFKLVRPDLGSFHDSTFKWPLSGKVSVENAKPDGPCGTGLHLGKSFESSLKYAKFPFRVLEVRPLSPILGQDDNKIRVASAEIIREIPAPAWAKKLEKRLADLPAECRGIPWFAGTDSQRASKLIRSHFKLLVPFGFQLDFEIEIVNTRPEADKAWAAAWDAARAAA